MLHFVRFVEFFNYFHRFHLSNQFNSIWANFIPKQEEQNSKFKKIRHEFILWNASFAWMRLTNKIQMSIIESPPFKKNDHQMRADMYFASDDLYG